MKEPRDSQDSGVFSVHLPESQVVCEALFAVYVITQGCLQSTRWHLCHCCHTAAPVSGLIKVGLTHAAVNEVQEKESEELQGRCTQEALMKQLIKTRTFSTD